MNVKHSGRAGSAAEVGRQQYLKESIMKTTFEKWLKEQIEIEKQNVQSLANSNNYDALLHGQSMGRLDAFRDASKKLQKTKVEFQYYDENATRG